MDIIKRNFIRLLRSGALNEYESIEPMSAFKWRRLLQMSEVQEVNAMTLKGIRNHQYDKELNIPKECMDELMSQPTNALQPTARLSNLLFNRRLRKIREHEPNASESSMDTLALLDIIVGNTSNMLNKGICLRGIMEMGRYLRLNGNHVDFVKLDNWLQRIHIRRMAQLQGSMLIAVFGFEQDEVPFVERIEPKAGKIALRSIKHTAMDTAEEWHFRQTRSGFLRNNSTLLRRNLRRSIRYIPYAPIETTSNFVHNFARSLSEIEE